MFRTGLPEDLALYYNDEDNNKVFLLTQEDYENVIKSNPEQSLKVFIIEQEIKEKPLEEADEPEIIEVDEKKDSAIAHEDYEVISHANKLPMEADEEIRKDSLNSLEDVEKIESNPNSVENIDMIASLAESRIFEKIMSKKDMALEQSASLKERLHEALKEEIPHVIEGLKEQVSSIKDSGDAEQAAREAQKDVARTNNRKEKKENGFMRQLKDFGKEVKDSLKDFPEAFVDMMEDIACLMEGDPKYFYAGDMYPKSVCKRTEEMRRLFPEVPVRLLADFVNKMPKSFSLEQVVNEYLRWSIREELRKQAQETPCA